MSGADVKIGDRVHARTPNTAVPWLGTVTAIERSAHSTVYVVEVGHNTTIRATEATVAEVSDEPTWRQTAENLREALALVTKERDRHAGEAAKARVEAAEARKDAQKWGLLASKYERVRAEAQAAQEGYRDAMAQLWRAEDERDAALKDCEEKVLAIRDYQKREATVDQCFDLLVEARLIDRLPATPDLKVQLLRDAIRKLCTEGLAACDALRFLRRTAIGGSIVSSTAMTPPQIAAARAADRMLVTPDGYGFVYLSDGVAYEMTCDLERVTVECDALRRSVTAERDAAREERDALRKTGENLREALNFWCGRAETLAVSRDEAARTLERVTAERDALDRRYVEAIRALDLVTVERDALRRAADETP